jgi:very-short-patch-repair endonuclease
MPHAAVSAQQRNRAKSFRRAMTRAETLLWRYLKAHHIDDLGFRRQVPMRGYVADFACHSARLIVELDGESHDFESRQGGDARRDAWFRSEGYTVLRFTNEDVLTNLEGVVAAIRNASVRMMASPPSLSLPHKGGGNPRTTGRRGTSPSPTLPRKRGREQAGMRGEIE